MTDRTEGGGNPLFYEDGSPKSIVGTRFDPSHPSYAGKTPMTNHTEALDIEAIERRSRQLGAGGHDIRTLLEALKASNEERERVRALVPHIRARQRSGWVANDFDWLCAALSHPEEGAPWAGTYNDSTVDYDDD